MECFSFRSSQSHTGSAQVPFLSTAGSVLRLKSGSIRDQTTVIKKYMVEQRFCFRNLAGREPTPCGKLWNTGAEPELRIGPGLVLGRSETQTPHPHRRYEGFLFLPRPAGGPPRPGPATVRTTISTMFSIVLDVEKEIFLFRFVLDLFLFFLVSQLLLLLTTTTSKHTKKKRCGLLLQSSGSTALINYFFL